MTTTTQTGLYPKLDKLLRDFSDVFTVTIRGHAILEEMIDDAIAEAFDGSMPAELRH